MADATKPAKSLPRLDDTISAPFWESAGRNELAFQRCSSCGYLRWPPAAICPECWSGDAEWMPVSPEGEVWSFGVYERAFSKAFEGHIPYVVALVQLDAGPRMISNVVTVDPDAVSIGMRVTAVFEPFANGNALVKFRPI
jgi:uncharacterized protein